MKGNSLIPTQITRKPRITVTISVAGMWKPLERMIEVMRVQLVKSTKYVGVTIERKRNVSSSRTGERRKRDLPIAVLNSARALFRYITSDTSVMTTNPSKNQKNL